MIKKQCLRAIIVSLSLLLVGSVRASLSAFVWADAQPPTVNTSTLLVFHDTVHDSTVTFSGLAGATLTGHTFDASFPSLPSPLGPLGPGKEDVVSAFLSSGSILDITVAYHTPVLDTEGDIIDAVPSDGVSRIGTESKHTDGLGFTEQLTGTGTLDLDLTNFLFELPPAVPEVNTLPIVLGTMGAAAIWGWSRRRRQSLSS